MQNIPISLAKDGMTIARAVMRPGQSGSIPICGKGTSLTEALLERLVEMGVQSVMVEGHPVIFEGEATVEEMFAKLEHRFKHLGEDALMMTLKEIYRKQIIQSMSE